MTSSIRKDLGGGYMAKTRNGHFYKLDVNALGEPGKGRELPNLGTVLDTSKHKFIGKDKVDLNLLKEGFEIEPPEHVKVIGKEVHKTLHELGVHGKRVSYDYDSYKGPKHHRITVELGHYHPQEEKILDTLQSRHAPYKFHYGPNDVEIGTAAVIHPAPSNKMILKENINEDLDHDHPDMKAYHAACKARDEAHLASIRYRMNHDIKQPEHRAKYDELEAEHHRLRDIEDAIGEKVNGRLFAHHATKK